MAVRNNRPTTIWGGGRGGKEGEIVTDEAMQK
jgi:hypothetical protein